MTDQSQPPAEAAAFVASAPRQPGEPSNNHPAPPPVEE